jgi:S-adenosylmethionine hydrolase
MIVLFTDFGVAGPYTGQMKAVLAAEAPDILVIDLMADAPAFDPQASAHLLSALISPFPRDTVFLAVVDPGVGSARRPIFVEADGRGFVGPDNGLLSVVARRAERAAAFVVDWRPGKLSASFHGRDLFAPVAAMLARGRRPYATPLPLGEMSGWQDPDELPRIVYIDAYGNAMTGLRAAKLPAGTGLRAADRLLRRARTFSDVAPGEAFWYENALGLAEVAVNRDSAARMLGLEVGSDIEIEGI